MPAESDLTDLPPLVPMSSAVMADAQAQIAGMDRDYCPPEPQPMADAKHWAALVKARATIAKLTIERDDALIGLAAGRDAIARVDALIATWHKSPEMRALANRLSEALDGRPRAIEPQLLPHSRACGIRKHEHGAECHSNCPTCGSRAKVTLR